MSDTKLPSYQTRVAAFVSTHDLDAPPVERLLDLVAEVGELAKEVLEGSDYGQRELTLAEGWDAELGDAFFSLICLANATDVDLERALAGALEKFDRRLSQGGAASSGR